MERTLCSTPFGHNPAPHGLAAAYAARWHARLALLWQWVLEFLYRTPHRFYLLWGPLNLECTLYGMYGMRQRYAAIITSVLGLVCDLTCRLDLDSPPRHLEIRSLRNFEPLEPHPGTSKIQHIR